MVKRILLPLDTSAYSDAATEYAIQIAKRSNAQIDGMVILDIEGIEKSIGPVAMGGLYWAEKLEKKKAEEAHEHINKLLDKFAKRCKEAGVKSSKAEFQGAPEELIIQQSIYYDVVVMGLRTYYKFGEEEQPGKTLDTVLGNTITPIVAVPEKYNSIEGGNALIAFDGSVSSARALQRFVHLAVDEDINIRIITSSDDKEYAESLLQNAKSYVSAYLNKEIETIWTRDNIIDAINRDYLDWADIFVVGAHSKSAFMEFIVGSLTKNLIKYAKKPLFIG